MYSSSWHLNSNTWQNVGNRKPNILQLNYLNISSSSSNSSYVNKSVTYRWWCSWNQSPNDNIDINRSSNLQQIWLLHVCLIWFWILTPSFLFINKMMLIRDNIWVVFWTLWKSISIWIFLLLVEMVRVICILQSSV